MTSDSATATPRPPELTAVVVLTYVNGGIEMALGLLVLLARYLPEIRGTELSTPVTVIGAAILLLGLLTAAVASAISRGERAARIILTVLVSIGVGLNVAILVTDPSTFVLHVAPVALAIAQIAVMWTGRARRYFRDAGA